MLTSPRVVRVVDLDAAAEPPFLVLEYVAGETLQARWRREGRLAPGEALAIVLEVARALEDAHAHGIVHRDLKPQNVMLADGQVKVLDFGIARVAELPGLTAPGALLGTPAYAPPEWASGTADGRADLYALGVILFALLEGDVPFRGPTADGRAAPARGGPPAPDGAHPPGGAAGAAALPGQGPRAALPDPRRAGRGAGVAAAGAGAGARRGTPAATCGRRQPGRDGSAPRPPAGGPEQLRGPGARGGRRCGGSCAGRAGPRGRGRGW